MHICLYKKCNLAFQNSLKSAFVDAWVRAHAKWTELPEEAKKNFEEEYQQKIKDYKDFAAACKTNKKGEGQKKHSQKKQVGAPKRPAGGAYGCFVASKRVEFQAECKRQGLQVTSVSTMAGRAWKALPEEQKQKMWKSTFRSLVSVGQKWRLATHMSRKALAEAVQRHGQRSREVQERLPVPS